MNNDRRNEIAALFLNVAAAAETIAKVRATIDDIASDERETFEAMPDGIKASDRGQVSEAAIAALETAKDAIDAIDLNAVMVALEEAADRVSEYDVPPAKLDPVEAAIRRHERLPAWARAEIDRLKTEFAKFRDKTAAQFADPAPGSLKPIVGDYVTPLEGKELPCERVKFPQVGVTVYIQRSRDGDMLEIHGEGMLTITPNASNTIHVKSERWGR